MIKSLLTGVFFGGVLGSAAILIGTFIAPQPAGNAPPAPPTVELPVATAEEPGIDNQGEAPDVSATADETQDIAVAPQSLEADAEAVVAIADTTPAEVPATAAVEGSLDAPEVGQAPDLTTQAETPVLPNPQSVAPQVPSSEDAPQISTQAAPLPEPEPVIVTEEPEVVVEAVPSAPEPEQEETTDTTIVAAPVENAPDQTVVPGDETAPEVPETEVAQDTVSGAETGVENAVAEVVETEPEAVPTPLETTDPPAEAPETPIVAELNTPSQAAPSAEETPEPAEPEQTSGPVAVNVISERSNSLPTGNGAVRVNRRIGQAATTPSATEAPAEEAGSEETLPADAPALLRFAAKFENPDDMPLLSVVLIDDVLGPAEPAVLAALPFPVTVALDSASPDAPDRMKQYRAAGIEVAAMTTLPDGATPADVAVVMEAVFARMSETVLLLDAGKTGLQSNRAVTAQTIDTLAQQGRGLVTIAKGLNMAQRAAESANVPSALVFRDLDGDGQDARVIGRFLDQAAFRARQESGVVLLARVRPQTLEALAQWGNSGGANEVSVAPASAVLMQ